MIPLDNQAFDTMTCATSIHPEPEEEADEQNIAEEAAVGEGVPQLVDRVVGVVGGAVGVPRAGQLELDQQEGGHVLDQQELDAAEYWVPYSTSEVINYAHQPCRGEKWYGTGHISVLSLTKPRVLGVLAQDEARWADARAARNLIRALCCGLLSVEEVQELSGNWCCVPPAPHLFGFGAGLGLVCMSPIILPLTVLQSCRADEKNKICVLSDCCSDSARRVKHRHALILTDQGLVGHGPAPDYLPKAIAWENLDVENFDGIEILQYDKHNSSCYSTDGCCIPHGSHENIYALRGGAQLDGAMIQDPLWCFYSPACACRAAHTDASSPRRPACTTPQSRARATHISPSKTTSNRMLFYIFERR